MHQTLIFDRWRRYRSVAQEKPTCLRDRISDHTRDLESASRFPLFARTKGSRSQAFKSTSRPARSLVWCTSMLASRKERTLNRMWKPTALRQSRRTQVSDREQFLQAHEPFPRQQGGIAGRAGPRERDVRHHPSLSQLTRPRGLDC
jgi:hypothetical protein